MLSLYLPANYTPGDDLLDGIAYAKDLEDAQSRAMNGQAVLFDDKIRSKFYDTFHRSAGVLVKMNKAQPRAGRLEWTVIFSWSFSRANPPSGWGGEMKLAFLDDPLKNLNLPDQSAQDEPPALVRQKIRKSVMSVDPDLFERDLTLLEHAISILVNKRTLEAAGFYALRSPVIWATGVETRVREAVQAALEQHMRKADTKAQENKAAQDLLSSLPDGTPLIIRNGWGNTWQLGLKKGRADTTLARNAMIAPSEVLRSDELRAAGLSAHDVLPLDMVAQKAREAFPDACRFQSEGEYLSSQCELHPGQPFHESFLTGRRKRTPAAWIGSQSYSSYHGRFVLTSGDIQYRSARFGTDTHSPPYINLSKSPVILKEKSRYGEVLPVLPRFGQICGLWCLESDVVEVMRSHQIGDVDFTPVTILDINGEFLKDDYHFLSVDTPVAAVLRELCSTDTLMARGGRVLQPFEITIDTNVCEGLDFWWDDTVRSGSFFFSDRLYKALKKIKAMPRIAPKPCAGV